MTETAVAKPTQARDDRRAAALLKALGLDKVPEEQRELALAIAKKYDLDPMLKHLVLIEGRPYITRDGLLWVAHRSKQLDGIEVTDPEIIEVPGKGSYWFVKCSVYRKDMTRPFTYGGRYPTRGGNEKYGPEMAVKVSEVMALRRAFNVSAPAYEERWEVDAAVVSASAERPSLAEQIASRRQEVVEPAAPEPTPVIDTPEAEPREDLGLGEAA